MAEGAQAVDAAVRAHVRILEVDPWNEGAHLGLVRVMERAGAPARDLGLVVGHREVLGGVFVVRGPWAEVVMSLLTLPTGTGARAGRRTSSSPARPTR